MSHKFRPGDIVYNLAGASGFFIGEGRGGFVVEPIAGWNHEELEYVVYPAQTWVKLYANSDESEQARNRIEGSK